MIDPQPIPAALYLCLPFVAAFLALLAVALVRARRQERVNWRETPEARKVLEEAGRE